MTAAVAKKAIFKNWGKEQKKSFGNLQLVSFFPPTHGSRHPVSAAGAAAELSRAAAE